jgi:hypothetical protein
MLPAKKKTRERWPTMKLLRLLFSGVMVATLGALSLGLAMAQNTPTPIAIGQRTPTPTPTVTPTATPRTGVVVYRGDGWSMSYDQSIWYETQYDNGISLLDTSLLFTITVWEASLGMSEEDSSRVRAGLGHWARSDTVSQWTYTDTAECLNGIEEQRGLEIAIDPEGNLLQERSTERSWSLYEARDRDSSSRKYFWIDCRMRTPGESYLVISAGAPAFPIELQEVLNSVELD